MIVVGLTGSLASGKSEVAGIFKAQGARVFDADASARALVRKGKPAFRAIVKLFGDAVIGKNGELDRKKLAAHVFAKPSALKKLNTLLHPSVIMDCMKMIEATRSRSGVLVLDAPLLFEAKMERLADVLVVVRSKPETVFSRALERGMSRELVEKILKSQWPVGKKAAQADFVIENDGSKKDLERKARELYQTFSVHKGGK